jgi:AraC-like DNA-binding protein
MPDATSLVPKRPRTRRAGKRDASAAQALRHRDEWLAQIAAESQFHCLFDLLPGIHFFAKDRHGRTMYSSRGILQLYGFGDEREIVGLTDFDLNPAAMAESYVRDDERIFATGAPVLEKVELWFDEQALPAWFRVSKLPIRSRTGEIIGIMGILQKFAGGPALPPAHRLIEPAVAFIRENFASNLEMTTLARRAGISPRQLQRRFRATLGLSPQELLIKTRVLAASRALRETAATIAEISAGCGFYDQSSFTEHFRRYLGTTPSRYRRSARHGDDRAALARD